MSGRIALQHVVAEAQPLQHARRKPFGHDIADAHQVLGDLQPLRVADVQRNAALAGVLVVEMAAHVGVPDPRQRPGRRVARGAAADRRHRRQPRVGIVLPLDLEALRAHRGEKPRAAGRGEKPGEIEDLDALQRKRLVVQRRDAAGSRRRAAVPARSAAASASPSTASVSSPSSGARRPTCQLVLLLSHLLVG